MDVAQYVDWSSEEHKESSSKTTRTKIYFYMKTKRNLWPDTRINNGSCVLTCLPIEMITKLLLKIYYSLTVNDYVLTTCTHMQRVICILTGLHHLNFNKEIYWKNDQVVLKKPGCHSYIWFLCALSLSLSLSLSHHSRNSMTVS